MYKIRFGLGETLFKEMEFDIKQERDRFFNKIRNSQFSDMETCKSGKIIIPIKNVLYIEKVDEMDETK